ncbi:MAG: aconitase X catalytic domain-containing protein [Candidatus Micrarchaeota archaeon]|nr:aconitase X catalytic domain-containing protein [Candidatus Micrarchaeota archaeon]
MAFMQLSSEQQSMLEGELGGAARQSMEILCALGRIYGARNMVPITSAQVAGVSYKTIGDAGLEYLQDIASAGARVRVPTFLNPAGMDREQWQALKVPPAFAKKQLEILAAFAKMGISSTCTCTPYLVGIRPKLGEHIAWSESSAISFANSVLGARTNREGGPSALAAAICGCTPNYGLHLDENRVANLRVLVDVELKGMSDYGAMGAYAGEAAKGKTPAFIGVKGATEDRLKSLGASMAAWGSTALYFMKGITPEWNVAQGAEEITFGAQELRAMREKMGGDGKPDIIAIGCPHASLSEIEEVAEKVQGKKLATKLWVCTARKTKEAADKAGFTRTIEQAGGNVVADTCMVVCPLEEMGITHAACNSGKAAKYLTNMFKRKVVYGDVEDIVCK